MLHEICVSGTVGGSPTNVKIPHLHIHKPKTVVVEPVLSSDFRVSGGPPVFGSVQTKLDKAKLIWTSPICTSPIQIGPVQNYFGPIEGLSLAVL